MARLPWEPEPQAALEARYAAAIEPVYDQLAVAAGRQAVPSGQRRHVFDYEDGLRLMVSREMMPTGLVVVHLSASMGVATAMYLHARAGAVGPQDFMDAVIDRWRVLSGSSGRVRLIGITSKGCPHWFAEEATTT